MVALKSPLFRGTSAKSARTGLVVEGFLVLLAGLGVLALLRLYSTNTAGGADSYGYVSEAIRLRYGYLYRAEQVFTPFGLPENSALTFPLGYRPSGSAGLVPTYPFGYPLLMAPAILLFGLAGAFWVTPLLGAGAIVLTYAIGRARLGRIGGLFAAALTLLLPNFLWSAFQPMSDVPATFFAALALFALLVPRPRPWTAALLAVAVGTAIWIRPNLALLVVPSTLWLLAHQDWRRLLIFGLFLFPFLAIEAVANQYLYGAPWSTGYGQPTWAPSPLDALQRAARYLGRLQDQQAGIGLLLLALGIFFGRLAGRIRVLLISIGALFLAFFAIYPIDDAWWYGRFLLPAVPAVALLESSALVRLVEPGRWRAARGGALVLGIAVFSFASINYAREHDTFRLAEGELRYQTAARFTRDQVDPPALVLAMQHSGTLRLYGGLPTVRYDRGPLPELLQTLGQVSRAGGKIYLLGEGWELDRLKQSDRAILLAGAEELGELEPGHVVLYRLTPPLDPDSLVAQHRSQITFGDQLMLDGYDLSAESVEAGDDIRVTFYWQALRVPDQDYSVFVHLVDAAGTIVAQSDAFPMENRYPTSRWKPGYAVPDTHRLTIPADAPPGPYRLAAGLYQYQTLQRLHPGNAAGQLSTDYLPLGTLSVVAR